MNNDDKKIVGPAIGLSVLIGVGTGLMAAAYFPAIFGVGCGIVCAVLFYLGLAFIAALGDE